MKLLNEISNQPKQKFIVNTESNRLFQLELEYIVSQQGWFYNITFGDFQLTGQRLAVGPNILNQYRRILPFGISCTTKDGQDPFFQDDFSTSRIELFLLTQSEVDQINDALF
jgi:hypothetical protein